MLKNIMSKGNVLIITCDGRPCQDLSVIGYVGRSRVANLRNPDQPSLADMIRIKNQVAHEANVSAYDDGKFNALPDKRTHYPVINRKTKKW